MFAKPNAKAQKHITKHSPAKLLCPRHEWPSPGCHTGRDPNAKIRQTRQCGEHHLSGAPRLEVILQRSPILQEKSPILAEVLLIQIRQESAKDPVEASNAVSIC